MKLVHLNVNRGISVGSKRIGNALASVLAKGNQGPEARPSYALDDRYERMAGALDQVSAALATISDVDGLIGEMRQTVEIEGAARCKDQGEISALRARMDTALRDLAVTRQSEMTAKAALSTVTADIEALRMTNADLETRLREIASEEKLLRASLANEQRGAAGATQTAERLARQTAYLEEDLAQLRIELKAAEERLQTAETEAAAAERTRALLEADLSSLRQGAEQVAVELIENGRHLVELEKKVADALARAAVVDGELAASRDENTQLKRELDQRNETFSSRIKLGDSRQEVLQSRVAAQEQQLTALSRLAEDLAPRERAAVREAAEAKLLQERAVENLELMRSKCTAAEDECGRALAARQAAVARAEKLARTQQQKLAEVRRLEEQETALRHKIEGLEQRLHQEREAAETRINELSGELERERAEKLWSERSLQTSRKERSAALTKLAKYDAGTALAGTELNANIAG